MRHVLVQSHRGGGALAPEHTAESFAATWGLGAVPEADLRTTRDGVIVAFHDETFARVVKDLRPELREKGVRDVTFAELAALDVGAWKGEAFAGQRVCSLEEIFRLMQGRPERSLYLDIKDVQLPRLADLVRDLAVVDQVILAAPDERALRDWGQLVPHAQTLLWMGARGKGGERSLRRRLQRLRDEGFAGITQLQLHVAAVRRGDAWQLSPPLGLLRQTAEELAAFGVVFQALPWDCAEAEVYRLLVGAGVRSFASDYPEVALQVLRDWAEPGPRSDGAFPEEHHRPAPHPGL